MNKVILDFRGLETLGAIQEYLALKLDFPEYYGRNLDALYDELTSISTATCIGVFGVFDLAEGAAAVTDYLVRLSAVMRDAENENDYLAVIFGQLEENF